MPSAREAEKLLAVQPILQYHRRDRLIEPLLVEAPPAAVALHARSLILISNPALRLLDSVELQAIAAHELGHDYFWDEYEAALASGEYERMQELELRCDAVSVFTLADLGLNPRKLASGLARINEFNERFGPLANVKRYVPAPERARFVEALIQRVSDRTRK
jgi:Zn-dependent protease with chaperone function